MLSPFIMTTILLIKDTLVDLFRDSFPAHIHPHRPEIEGSGQGPLFKTFPAYLMWETLSDAIAESPINFQWL